MDEIQITDNGETEVQLTTLGTVYGSDAEGNPVEQHFTEVALANIAETQKDEEILVDSDHESEKGGSTAAAGWVSDLHVKPGKGLFGKIKWTDIGRKLIENRVFRWLSPSFWLNKKTKEPVQMTSVALTNKPSQAGEIQPIINSAPMALGCASCTGASCTGAYSISQSNMEEITMTITKEELVSLIKETVVAMNTSPVGRVQDSDKSEEGEVVNNACSKESDKSESDKSENKKTEAKNSEEAEQVSEITEEVKEEVKEEIQEGKESDKSEDEEEEEVIKIEAVNSAPTPKASQDAEWRFLRGQRFFDYLKQHPELTR